MSSKEIIRVYVAGKYSAGNVIDVLENMRRGMQIGVEVLAAGFAPFVPWFDYHFTLMRPDGAVVGIDEYYRYSMAWLEASHCILVISGEKDSTGVIGELNRAKELGLPIFHTVQEVVDYYAEKKQLDNIAKEEDPWDAFREKFWKYTGNAHDPDMWYCKLHAEAFDISDDYCSTCADLVDAGWTADEIERSTNVDRLGEEVIPDELEDHFDEGDEMDEEG